MNDPTLHRVRRWYDALPADDRPDWDDVEVVVRLGVARPDVAQRLLWDQPGALARRFDALRAVIDGREPVVESRPETVAGKRRAVDVSDASRVETRLLDWLETLRLEGVELSPDAVEQLTKASSLSQLRGLVPRELLRRRGDELARLLGIGTSPEPVDMPVPTIVEPAATSVEPEGFAPFSNWSTVAQTDVRFSASAGQGIGLSWDEPTDSSRVHIFRVTARDDYEPASPDESRLVATTYDTAATDRAVFATAKRHFAVWLHRGRDERSARASQPELWAVGTCVLPVRDVRLTVVDGQVAGTWSVADGVDRVEVLRVPEAEATTEHYNGRYRIGGDHHDAHLLGFEDHPEPGSWVYRMYACATHNGEPLRSPLVQQSVLVAAVLPRVHDLEVVSDPTDPDLHTLSWTRPSLPDVSVEIYRHTRPLQAGIESRVLDREAMTRYGLTEETRVNQPATERDGQMLMERVRWPADSPRIHFTAVTRSWDGSQFQIGRTETRNRAGEVTHALLVERVDEQFVTFAWPEGADFVQIHQGARGAQVADVGALACLMEVSRDKYVRLGGAHLPTPLPASGCSLHLVGVSFHEGRPSRGPVCTIDYPGLARIEYRLQRPQSQPVRTGLFGRKPPPPSGPLPPRLSVRSDRDLESVTLVLVHHRSRLPLFPGEGERLFEGPVSLVAGTPVTLKEQLPELVGRGGFVRLFVVVPEPELEEYAVLDPPIEQLRCD